MGLIDFSEFDERLERCARDLVTEEDLKNEEAHLSKGLTLMGLRTKMDCEKKGLDTSVYGVEQDLYSLADLLYGMDAEKYIKEYHSKKESIINSLVERSVEDPKVFKGFMKQIFDISFGKRILPGVIPLIMNLTEVHYKLSKKRLGKQRYLLAVGDDGKLFSRELSYVKGKDYYENWMNLTDHAVTFFNLDSEALAKNVLDGEVWSNFLHDDNYPEIPQAMEVGGQLLHFGKEHKHLYSDLPHEIVLNAGNLHSITVLDNAPQGLAYKVKHDDGTILVGEIMDIENGYLIAQSDGIGKPVKWNKTVTRSGNIFALVGAIARDMFVLEERTEIYDISRARQRRITSGKAKKGGRYVWLPKVRINYIGKPDTSIEDKVFEVSPAHVTGHIRKVEKPSEKQLELAGQYGVFVPAGYTFVKPHDRGKYTKTSGKYKSRSALKTLFGYH